MADVTKLAGLSLGIVNLHFETKEKLLVETLRFITDEYRNGLDKIFSMKICRQRKNSSSCCI
ncbi:MAG: hypothetical protein CM15mP51_00320 [Porticoccaceae bacterium]|nr:MAG: hypothetical protein CM15mP51_00320 [Porticoccaceae bacterium]